MAFTYTTEPHPTCRGKLLAIAPKPDSWRCMTETEHAFAIIGGKHWRGHQKPGSVAYTLSEAQARDLDAILRAGFRPYSTLVFDLRDEGDPEFWHPDYGDEDFSRAEALEIARPVYRCRRTMELPLAA